MDEFDEIANTEFERTAPTLDRFARLFGLDHYHAGEPAPLDQFKLFGYDQRPINCRLCNENHWTIERYEDNKPGVFICEHGTVYGLIRQLDSVNMARVDHYELIGNHHGLL